ncbi:hypothetical protein K438DRAFT_1943408 [Mycena galopus ATCC 62051]|nr:hypothetical protein K438DRAFT_1943408 [Mycena galopus ATCC 62051]
MIISHSKFVSLRQFPSQRYVFSMSSGSDTRSTCPFAVTGATKAALGRATNEASESTRATFKVVFDPPIALDHANKSLSGLLVVGADVHSQRDDGLQQQFDPAMRATVSLYEHPEPKSEADVWAEQESMKTFYVNLGVSLAAISAMGYIGYQLFELLGSGKGLGSLISPSPRYPPALSDESRLRRH